MLGFDLSPEQQQLKETARRFAADVMMPVAARHDEEQTFPAEVARQAWELGLMNLEVPRELGGLGLGVLDTCLVLEELNYACAGMTNAIAANGLAATPVILAGTEEQQRRYVTPIATGEARAAFGLSEPQAGSDVMGMRTRARPDGDGWVLSGTKCWMSGVQQADWYCVFAKTSEVDSRAHDSISTFVVERSWPGVTVGRVDKKMGVKGDKMTPEQLKEVLQYLKAGG